MPARREGASLDVLREAARLRAQDTSVRQTAREIGVSHQTLQRFLDGAEPYSRSLAKLRQWHERGTNELLRLRQENAELRKQLEECRRELRKMK